MERMINCHLTSHDCHDIEQGEHSDQGVRNISDWIDSYIADRYETLLACGQELAEKDSHVSRLKLAETEGPPGSAHQTPSGQPARHE